ncbi:MAG: tyrosine-type recombinase/integrase [Chthoniobacteraceae bacterium]
MKIRKIRHRSGNTGWQVDFGLVTQPDGSRRRVQKGFKTKAEAEKALSDAKEKRTVHGDAAIALAESERIRFVAARDKLAAAGGTIEKAVELFLRHNATIKEPILLEELLTKCIDAKATLGASIRYLQQFRCSCTNFIRSREDRLAHTITRDEVRQWVLGQGWAPKTQRVYLGDLRALFAWARSEHFVAENPASGDGPEKIALAKLDDSAISRLQVRDVKRLFARIASVRRGEDFRPLLWYVALGLFCGIRPAELEKMDRGDVNLKERHAVVSAPIAKTRRRRVVDLSEAACAWLALDKRSEGHIIPVNFVRRWRRLRTELKLTPWPHDVMRHTFASMHYAEHQDEALLKAQMGHSAGEDTLMRHYRALATRAEAAAFWKFTPSKRRAKVWKQRPISEQQQLSRPGG